MADVVVMSPLMSEVLRQRQQLITTKATLHAAQGIRDRSQ